MDVRNSSLGYEYFSVINFDLGQRVMVPFLYDF